MNLTWHIVKKDCRRFWVGALLLAGFVVIKLALLDSVFHNEKSNRQMMMYQSLILIAEMIFSFFFAVTVVQEDPVSDPSAFWQTLPISRLQLLGAKLLSTVLLCVLPTLLALGLGWAFYALPADRIGCPAEFFGEIQLGLCLLAFAFGSLTKNMAHVIFWLIGVWLSFTVLYLIVEPLLDQFTSRQGLIAPGVNFTHLALFFLVAVVTALAMTLNQFLGRSRNRSIVFLAVGFAVSFAVIATVRSRFAFDFTSVILPAQHKLDFEVSQWKVEIADAELTKSKPGSDATFLLRVSVDRSGLKLVSYLTHFFGQWVLSKTGQWPKVYHSEYNPLKDAVAKASGFPVDSSADRMNFGAEAKIPAKEADRLRGRPASYQGQLELEVRDFSIEGQMALLKGNTWRSKYGTEKIVRADSDNSIVEVELEGRNAALSPDPGWITSIPEMVAPQTYFTYVLVNRKTQKVLTGAESSTATVAYAYGALFTHARLQFVLPQQENVAVNLADWTLGEVRISQGHLSIKTFTQDVLLKEVPTVKRDPDWLD